MLTRKHFTAIADELARLQALHGDSIPTDQVIAAMVTVCADSNPSFSPTRFRDHVAAKALEIAARWEARNAS